LREQPLSIFHEDTEKVNPESQSAAAKVSDALDEVTNKYDAPQDVRERKKIE
jgi:hypothetical protein